MPILYDKDGHAHEVPDTTSAVRDAMAEGLFARPGMQIGVKSPTGQGGTVPGENLAEALSKGFTLESPTEERERRMSQQYGDAEVRSFVEGAARTLTLGGSDVVLGELGGSKAREGLRERRERNVIGSTAGEVAGAIVPAVASGGSSVAGRVLASSPASLAIRTGEAAGALVKGSRALRVGVQGATEGALFGAGQTVSEASLSEHPLTTEQIAASLGTNMLFGAVTGGVIGGVGSKLGDAATAGTSKLRKVIANAEERIGPGPIGDDMLRAIAAKPTRAADLISAAKADAGSLRAQLEASLPKPAVLDDEVRAGIAKFRSEFDELQKLTRQERGILRKVEAPGDDVLAAHKRLVDAQEEVRKLFPFEEQIDVVIGKRGAPTSRTKTSLLINATDDDIARMARENPELFRAIENQRSAFVDMVQTRNPGTTLRGVSDIFKEPANSLESAALRTAAAERRLAGAAQNVDTAALQKIQSQLDDLERTVNMPRAEFDFQAAKSTIKMAEDAGLKISNDDMLKISNDGGLAGLTELPAAGSKTETLLRAKAYRAAAKAQLTARSGPRVPGGDSLDLLGAVAGDFLLEGMGGMLLGGLVGKLIAPMLGGRGNVKAALASAALWTGTRIADGIDALVARGTANLTPAIVGTRRALHNAAFGGEPKKNATDREALKTKAADIHALVSDPDAMRMQINNRLRPIHQADFRLGDKLAVAAENKMMFLASKAPRDPQMGEAATGYQRWQPSDATVARFARYVRAAEDPATVIDDMRAGKLTPEAVETLQVLYPEMYGQMQTQLMTQVASLNKSLPYRDRLQLSILFNVPIDSSMQPEFVAMLQSQFSEQQGTEPERTSASIPSRAIERMRTPEPTMAQRLMS